MKTALTIVLFLTFCVLGFCQELEKPDSHQVHSFDKYRYKKYHVVYPREALVAKIEGTITVTMDIDSTCSFINRVPDIELGYGCDDAVSKVLDKFEKDFGLEKRWKCQPRKNLTLPFEFKLR